jgi:hypothetical protein
VAEADRGLSIAGYHVLFQLDGKFGQRFLLRLMNRMMSKPGDIVVMPELKMVVWPGCGLENQVFLYARAW